MADPRGKGFNRGRGKWHAPDQQINIIDPADLGWTQTDDGYELDDVKLVPHNLGWMSVQSMTIGGQLRIAKQYISNALLPKFTEELNRDQQT